MITILFGGKLGILGAKPVPLKYPRYNPASGERFEHSQLVGGELVGYLQAWRGFELGTTGNKSS